VLTSYYASKLLDPKRHHLVRVSTGAPRYCKHRMAGALPLLYPDRAWLDLDERAYTRRYLAMLNRIGVAPICAAFASLGDEVEGRAVVLLCFESLSPADVKQGQFCHRRIFAKWWQDQTGEIISELTPAPAYDDHGDLFAECAVIKPSSAK
jgi:hypothetical protein